MEITQDINNICADLLERYKQSLKDNNHIASGNLYNTAKYKCSFDGKWFEVSFILDSTWRYLENGTKPHFPPLEAIERWITVKHIIPTTNSGKIPYTKQLAFLIARGISKNGTKPTKLLQQTIDGADDLIAKLIDALENQLQKEIQEEINKEEI